MSVGVADLLAEAERLAGQDSEIGWRAATSRAYYAAYHASKAWHDALPMPGSVTNARAGEHQRLIDQLRNPAPEVRDADQRLKSKSVAQSLVSLRSLRVIADYELEATVTREHAVNAIAQARLLVESLTA